MDWSNKCHDLFRTSDVTLSEITISSLDEQLLAKAMNAVENNISNADFTVEDLSEIVCMSRGYFYKKILAITGKNANRIYSIDKNEKSIADFKEKITITFQR